MQLHKKTKDSCKNCKKWRKTDYMRCQDCGELLWYSDVIVLSGDTHTAGYAGYNNGLGVNIENKGHYKKVIKETGAIPL